MNGNFDAGAQGWSLHFSVGGLAFDPSRDVDGYASSGSAELVNDNPLASGSASVRQCLGVLQPGKAYFFGTRLRFREGETAQGHVSIVVYALAQPNCSGALVKAASSPLVTTGAGRGVWLETAIGDASSGFTVPVGTQSVAMFIYATRVEPSMLLTLNFDEVFAAPVGTPLCDGLPATIIGTPGANVLDGTAGRDVIVGLGGNDVISGKGGNDVLCGSGGADTLSGGSGHDRLLGGKGDDLLLGQTGHDQLRGGAGDDDLAGGAGTDQCNGGPGAQDSAASCEVVAGVP